MAERALPTFRSLRARLQAHLVDLKAVPDTPERRAYFAEVHARHPHFLHAVAEDARFTAARRGERHQYRSRLDTAAQVVRLCLVTESFFAQCCYRGRARCRSLGIPLIPWFLGRLSERRGLVHIEEPVIVQPGLFLPHGQVIIGGITTLGRHVTVTPFTSIGLRSGEWQGPTIGDDVFVGTGARILGPWSIGDGATIGANAVVTSDVPAGVTVAGVPARDLAGGGTRS